MTWPHAFRGSRLSQLNELLASSEVATVTAGAANTKGSYAQIVASCPFDSSGFYLHFGGGNTGTHDTLWDIAVGAAGSEQIILANFLVSVSGFTSAKTQVFVPLRVKAGERIAVRLQSTTASATLGIGIQLCAGDFFSDLGLGRATTYGAVTADSGGTECDPGATAHTKGAWMQITASTTNPIRYMIVCVGSRNNGVYNASGAALHDVGVGAAGSEQVIVDDLHTVVTSGADLHDPGAFGRPVSVAAGQRLASRCQTGDTDANDRLRDIVIIGFD